MENPLKNLGGLRPRTEDERDFFVGALIAWPKLEELPEEFFVEPVSIKNQNADGNEDACAACAGAGMIEPKEETELFYPYLFAAAKFESGDDPDSWGLEIRNIGKALQKWGIPKIKDVPEEIKKLDSTARRRFENYPDSLREKAKEHKQKTYFFVNGPYSHYDNARALQWYFRKKKQNILLGVLWGWSIGEFELTGTPGGFGHALWGAGWYRDGLRIINSVGREAGKEGRHKLSPETFNEYAKKFGVLTIVDMDREEVEHMLANKIRFGDSPYVYLWKELIGFFKDLWKRISG